MVIPRMTFETHPRIYPEVQPDGSILINLKKPDGWRCATCGDPDCPWLSHRYFPRPPTKEDDGSISYGVRT